MRNFKNEVKQYWDGWGVSIRLGDEGLARHFYNLALEDVKKEVERLKECVGKASSDLYDFTDRMEGELNAYDDIKNFIDQLSK